MILWDTHSHILDTLLLHELNHSFENIRYSDDDNHTLQIPSLFLQNDIKSCVMTTHPRYWEHAIKLFKNNPNHICPALGIHPWIVQEYKDDINIDTIQYILIIARQYLQKYPNCIIGEIGLDQTEKRLMCSGENISRALSVSDVHDSSIEIQFLVFKHFWELACEFERPISLHCVKSDSLIMDFISMQLKLWKQSTTHDATKYFPPSLTFHSYTGSAEFMKQLYSLNLPTEFSIYTSFSKAITGRLSKSRLASLLQIIPIDRILIESDESSINNVIPGLNWCIDTILDYTFNDKCPDTIESTRLSIVNQLNKNSSAFLNIQ